MKHTRRAEVFHLSDWTATPRLDGNADSDRKKQRQESKRDGPAYGRNMAMEYGDRDLN
jgi:hypothetical protein